MDEFAETLGTLDFLDPNLDKLRQEILLLYGSDPDLDPDGVNNYLQSRGYSEHIESILDPAVYIHAGFARAEAAYTSVRVGIGEMVGGLQENGQRADMAEAEKAYAGNPTEENWARLQEHMVTVHQQDQVNKEKDYPEFVAGDSLQNTRNKSAREIEASNDIKRTNDKASGSTVNDPGKDLEINF